MICNLTESRDSIDTGKVTEILMVVHTKAENIEIFNFQSDKVRHQAWRFAIVFFVNQHSRVNLCCTLLLTVCNDGCKGITLVKDVIDQDYRAPL